MQRCIAVAMDNSIYIKIKQLEIVKAQKSYTNPLFGMLPQIGMFGSHNYNFGSTIDPETNNRVSSDLQFDSFGLNANMDILNFGNIALSQKEKINIELAKADKAVVEYEYKMQLLEKFFDALFTQELLKIQKEQFENSTLNLTRIEKETEIGSKSKSDLYDMQFSFSQDEMRLAEAKQSFEMQKLQLFQLMNFEPENLSEVVLGTNFPTEKKSNVFENPKITYAKIAYKSSRKDISIYKSANLPTISGSYSLSSFYTSPINQPGIDVTPFHTQIDNNKNHSVGLQLSIPVFNGFRNKKQIVAAKFESRKSKLISVQEQIKIDQQIKLEVTKKSQLESLSQNLGNTLKYAKLSFKTTQAKFTNGTIDAIGYIAVKNQLLSSEYEFLKNELQQQFTTLKINLIQTNDF
ncbi:TolC family protein [Flavobacterium sp. 3HN19-14]|uniref:TolC family protein n=1 Tax=Flavobacterium sp. 3HN19-14 TaxID=3448133 RepID=UPI003EE20EB4